VFHVLACLLCLDDGIAEKQVDFDFLIGEEFLRGTLEELVLRHEALKQGEENKDENEELGVVKPKIGVEEVIEIEYVERTAPPEPENVLMHDDWVSAVDATDKW
jgi:ribosome biogenesis protein YTM1